MILKSRLLTTAFIVPFTVSAALAPVQAFDIRDTDADAPRSTPVDTSTTTGDLNDKGAHELASTATIEIDGTPQSNSDAAVLVNSNGQSVLIDGDITIRDRDDNGDSTAISLGDAYGVRVTSNLPSGITLRLGSSTDIIINEVQGPNYDGDDDDTLPDNNDSDEDGIIEGSPALTGTHTRIGLWIEGAITEDVIGEGGTIRVDGNGARGVQIDGALSGNFDFSTALAAANGGILGDDAVGVEVNADIDGYYRQRRDIDVRGENGIGIEIDSSVTVDGGMMIDSHINATGYSTYSSAPVHGRDESELEAAEVTANTNERRRGGAAVDIAGDLDGGLIIGGRVDRVLTQAERDRAESIIEQNTDDDGDRIDISGGTVRSTPVDFDANRATNSAALLSSYGEGANDATLKITGDVGLGDGTNVGSIETLLDLLDDDAQVNSDGDSDPDIYTRGTVGLKQFYFSHGLVNRGRIEANGQYDGFKADAVLIDGSSTIHGGIYNSGAINAYANNANATTIELNDATLTSGLRTDGSVFLNDGTIEASISTHPGADDSLTADSYTATAILLSISTAFTPSPGETPLFVNRNSIATNSRFYAADSSSYVDNYATAFHFTAYTGNIDIKQEMPKDDELLGLGASATVNSASNPYRGGGDLDIDRAGNIGKDDNGDDINIGDGKIDTRDVAAPSISGDVLFGGGNNIFKVTAGSVVGNIDFGGGTDEFLLGNSMEDDANAEDDDPNDDVDDEDNDYTAPITVFRGAIKNSDTLNIDTLNITLGGQTSINGEKTRLHFDGQEGRDLNGDGDDNDANEETDLLTIDSMTLKEKADLRFTVNSEFLDDADNDDVIDPILNIGTFEIDGSDATITPLLSNLSGSARTEVKLFEYSTLTLNGDISDYLSGETPFIYNVTLDNHDTDKIISATFARKSADELGLNRTEAAAFDAVIAHFSSNDALGNAMVGLTNKTDFTAAYEQIFPHYSDGTAQQLSGLADMATGAVSQHLQIVKAGGRRGGDGWLQQFGDYRKQDTSSNGQTVSGNNYAIALGYDLPVFAIDALGLYMQIGFSSVDEKSTSLNNVKSESISYGAYLSDAIGPLQYQLNAAYGFVDLESERLINFNGIGTASNNPVIADWEATSTAASARLAYPIFEDDYLLRLEAGVDYFRLEHDDYAERQNDFDNGLAMRIAGGESEKTSQFIGLRGGYRAGEGSDGIGIVFEPNYYLGWRSNSDTSPYSATANFIGTEDNTFELKSHIEPEDAFDLGLGFAAHNDYFAFEFNYRARIADDEETHGGGISIRLLF